MKPGLPFKWYFTTCKKHWFWVCFWEWCIFSVQHFCTVRSGSYSLIPNATCRSSLKSHRQAGRHRHTVTLTHTLCFPQNCTHGKGNLDHRGTVKLSIKSQTNDVSSPLYLFKGWENSNIHVYTLTNTQRGWYLITSSTNTNTPQTMFKYFGFTRCAA